QSLVHSRRSTSTRRDLSQITFQTTVPPCRNTRFSKMFFAASFGRTEIPHSFSELSAYACPSAPRQTTASANFPSGDDCVPVILIWPDTPIVGRDRRTRSATQNRDMVGVQPN